MFERVEFKILIYEFITLYSKTFHFCVMGAIMDIKMSDKLQQISELYDKYLL